MVARRTLLGLGMLAASGGLSAVADTSSAAVTGRSSSTGAHHGHGVSPPHRRSASVTPFSVEMPLPPTLRPVTSTSDTDTYVIDVRRIHTEILPGMPTPALGFGNSFLGPTIHASVGRRTRVVQRNQLDEPVAVHLHGAHVSADSDGHPMDLIPPGGTKTYEYPNNQNATTMWYHDHAHHHEAEHVYRGLAGFYLLHDPAEKALDLPQGESDIPVMLRDAHLAEDGSMVWGMNDFERDTVLVNGRPQPYFEVAARKYRLRLLNASNKRTFSLRLSDGHEFVQIGSDGGLLPAPHRTSQIPLWSGERIDVVVDFSAFPKGSQVILENTLGDSDVNRRLLRFDVTRTAQDTSTVPDRLAPAPELPPASRERTFTLAMDPVTFRMQINGRSFDPARVDEQVPLGATEIWKITNADIILRIPHSFHIHLVQFRVLDRNGRPPGPDEAGWKDTVKVDPGETVRVQATFGGYTGRYVYHCHLIDHAAGGMMGQFEVVG